MWGSTAHMVLRQVCWVWLVAVAVYNEKSRWILVRVTRREPKRWAERRRLRPLRETKMRCQLSPEYFLSRYNTKCSAKNLHRIDMLIYSEALLTVRVTPPVCSNILQYQHNLAIKIQKHRLSSANLSLHLKYFSL